MVVQMASGRKSAGGGIANILGASAEVTAENTISEALHVLVHDAENEVIKLASVLNVCFLQDTLITLSDKTQKKIQDLKEDDLLLSFKFNNLDNFNKDNEYLLNWYSKNLQGDISDTKVLELWSNETEEYYIINDKLKVTPEHLLFVQKNNIYEWYSAKNLKKGYKLLNDSNKLIEINKIEKKREKKKVYNIKLKGIMNYYANNFLVHGSSKCDECGK